MGHVARPYPSPGMVMTMRAAKSEMTEIIFRTDALE
jgi:hypothetical protein